MDSKSDLCEQYERDVAAIAVIVGDLTIPDLLTQIEQFGSLYKDANRYLDCARQMIVSSDHSDLEKQISALTMHGAGLDDYLGFAESAVAGHRAERLSLAVLEVVVVPPADWANTLVFNYDYPRVVQIYEYYLSLDDADPTTVEGIRGSVLTGETAEFLRETYGK